MKFVGHLLGLTKTDRERNRSVSEKRVSAELCLGNTTGSKTVATERRENGYRNKHQGVDQREEKHRTTKEKMGGPILS
jgi:hypothetical protein